LREPARLCIKRRQDSECGRGADRGGFVRSHARRGDISLVGTRVLRICWGMSDERADESWKKCHCPNQNKLCAMEHTSRLLDSEWSDDALGVCGMDRFGMDSSKKKYQPTLEQATDIR
jgi:hypothetical protein